MSAEAYSIDQVAEILDCQPEKAVERIIAGELPGVKYGRGWIIPREAFCKRLNEIALELAQERRKAQAATSAATKVIKVAQQPANKPGSRARVPPALPSSC